jgi:uncharacterized protein with ACT and thioredoxin-like domain
MKNLSKSTKKYIRTEKARIYREIFDIKEQKKLIDELYKKVIKSPKIKEPVSKTKNKSIKVSKNETDLSKEACPVK